LGGRWDGKNDWKDRRVGMEQRRREEEKRI
jgi:hypothetical protein